MIINECMDAIRNILGPDVLIQKNINVSIQMPNDESSILNAHSDCSSGDSPFEWVIWIPVTDAYETNSMFIHTATTSRRFYESVNANEKYNIDNTKANLLAQ